MGNIKAIETEYNGYKFRSRLEARWAVFFDALGVDYEYEPEGFELPSGKYYLPDFKIKCYGTRGIMEKTSCNYCSCSIGLKGCKKWDKENSADDFSKIPNYVQYTPCDMGNGYVIEHCGAWETTPFDLYIEVKGNMTKEDAEKILEFYDEYPILIVGNIPYYDANDEYDISGFHCEERMNGIDIYPFNFYTVDGDFYPAIPMVHKRMFYLWSPDYGVASEHDFIFLDMALKKSRYARFEHGEKPVAELLNF